MNSIYSKIAALVILFNLAVLILFFSFDDYIPNEIDKKKEELIIKGNLLAKVIKPVLLTENISNFEKTIRIEDLFNDKRLYHHEQIKIYEINAKAPLLNLFNLSDLFIYYDEEDSTRRANLKKTGSIQGKIQTNDQEDTNFNLASKLFEFYQPLLNTRILTDPLVERRSRFLHQVEVVQGKSENYRIRVLAPIRENTETKGIIEV